jgi:transposase
MLAQVAADSHSTIPNLGASGAIAAVMGAFLVTYPRDQIRSVLFLFVFARVTFIPAVLLIGFWFITQLFRVCVRTCQRGKDERQRNMSRFRTYSPEQAYLIPPNVPEVLGSDHLSFFVHQVVERLDLKRFTEAYSEEGGELYHPALMLKVWLYAYTLGMTSSRRLEQRIQEDLGFRYLAGGAQPDYWALNEFRRRHARGINDVFVQMLEIAQKLGLARIGTVAIDSTRVKAHASPDRIDRVEQRQERAHKRRQVRRWQKACDQDDPNEGAGTRMGQASEKLAQVKVPTQLETLPKVVKRSRTDPDSRFLRERGGRFVLGYTGEIAVSEDHFIVAARVTQNEQDSSALVPMVKQVEQNCGTKPAIVLADSGFYANQNVAQLSQWGIDPYVPDPNLARELNGGPPATTIGRMQPSDPHLLAMRQKLRTQAGKQRYQHRKTLVEPVIGVLKEQRHMRQFRLRGMAKVSNEWMLAALAYNLGRLYVSR